MLNLNKFKIVSRPSLVACRVFGTAFRTILALTGFVVSSRGHPDRLRVRILSVRKLLLMQRYFSNALALKNYRNRVLVLAPMRQGSTLALEVHGIRVLVLATLR